MSRENIWSCPLSCIVQESVKHYNHEEFSKSCKECFMNTFKKERNFLRVSERNSKQNSTDAFLTILFFQIVSKNSKISFNQLHTQSWQHNPLLLCSSNTLPHPMTNPRLNSYFIFAKFTDFIYQPIEAEKSKSLHLSCYPSDLFFRLWQTNKVFARKFWLVFSLSHCCCFFGGFFITDPLCCFAFFLFMFDIFLFFKLN